MYNDTYYPRAPDHTSVFGQCLCMYRMFRIRLLSHDLGTLTTSLYGVCVCYILIISNFLLKPFLVKLHKSVCYEKPKQFLVLIGFSELLKLSTPPSKPHQPLHLSNTLFSQGWGHKFIECACLFVPFWQVCIK